MAAAVATEAVSALPSPLSPSALPLLCRWGLAPPPPASQLAEAGDGVLPPPQTKEVAASRAGGPRVARSVADGSDEAAARQQPT
ncbi:unnamed protein product [Miscanthus lutarioriparius]|uniref:Uncharacterized protein n=1 Tax=Miscanthus lutarioriparius TaxID=422564 RepID=A0A811QGA2_9POAL|nr:unnamed protein product [Miscanthus lutarioriparius]